MQTRRHILASTGALMASLPLTTRAALAGLPIEPEALLAKTWDYIIIGGGSAGCVLAHRLSEDKNVNVLLLEAGGEAENPAIFAPQAWPSLAGGENDWNFSSTPQSGLEGRTLPEPRGKGLGGSTLINALGFQRGDAQAYDRWAEETGDQGWSAASLLPAFRRLETASQGANKWRGGSGPHAVLQAGSVTDQNAYSKAYAAAGVEAGYPLNPDWNGEKADGTIWTQLAIREGRRETAATAYIDPIRTRPNLGILTGARAERLLVAGGRCTGAEVATNNKTRKLTATREIILSAGTIDSPRLLLLSGIGPAEDLKKLGIKPVHDLPGVGANLHDHPLVTGLLLQAKQPLPLSNYNHCETMVIASSSHAPGWADIQLMGLSVPFVLPGAPAPPANAFSLVPALMYPRSRGKLTLASADPRVQPLIDPAYLTDPRDAAALVDGFEIARNILAQPALKDWVASELQPGPKTTSRADLEAHIRRTSWPFYHPVSTCRMGRATDDMAVVDPQCRVCGLTGLRVIDASIFPSIPQAMTNAATLALAEHASDIIRS